MMMGTESFRAKGLERFVTDHQMHTLLVLFSAIVFVFFTTKDYIPFAARAITPFLLLFLITTQNMRTRVILLFWVILFLLFNLWLNFYVIANHGFMIAYIGIALIIGCTAGENGPKIVGRAAVLLISILMGLALFQKIVSVHYMSGDLIGSYIANGYMFKNLLAIVIPDWLQTVHQNLEAQRALMGERPSELASVSVTIPPFVPVMAIVLTWAALLSQAGLELCVLFRTRIGVWAHYAIMLFVLIIYTTRNENVFLSMNLILGYAMTDTATKSVRFFYVLGIAYLLITEMMGIRPGIIG